MKVEQLVEMTTPENFEFMLDKYILELPIVEQVKYMKAISSLEEFYTKRAYYTPVFVKWVKIENVIDVMFDDNHPEKDAVHEVLGLNKRNHGSSNSQR